MIIALRLSTGNKLGDGIKFSLIRCSIICHSRRRVSLNAWHGSLCCRCKNMSNPRLLHEQSEQFLVSHAKVRKPPTLSWHCHFSKRKKNKTENKADFPNSPLDERHCVIIIHDWSMQAGVSSSHFVYQSLSDSTSDQIMTTSSYAAFTPIRAKALSYPPCPKKRKKKKEKKRKERGRL